VTAGRTTVLIAHRASTLRLADQIAVLDHGQVADVGTHDDLLARCRAYQELLGEPVSTDEPAMAPGREGSPAAGAPRNGAAAAGPATGALGARTGAWAGGRGYGGALDDVPASPELLAQVAALPPAADRPRVTQEWARRPEPRFTLRRLLRPFAFGLLMGLVLDGLDALASIAMPALMGGGIDRGVLARSTQLVMLLAVAALVVVLADWVVNAAQTTVVGRNSERLLYALRVKIFAHLQRLGLDYYEREMAGRIMTRMTTDVDALSTFFQTGLITMVNSLLTFAGVLIAMLVINMHLGLTLLALVPVLAVVTVLFRSASSRAYAEAREKVSVVNADFQENVAGLRVVQAFRRERRNQAAFAALSSRYLRVRMRAQTLIALYFPFVQALSTFGAALVLLTAAGQVRAGALTAGALIAYLLYIDLLFSPIQQMSQVFDSYQQAAVGLRRIGGLLRTPTSTPAVGHLRPARLRGEIEFRDVTFRYPGQSAAAVAGVSLAIAPGETVALVGQTGAGKSTLVKLIARFYDVSAGQLLVDGADVRTFDLAAYRQRLGVVPQEPYLFAGTVSEAIGYARPDASQPQIEAAARAVGAYQMIAALPGGFAHQVAERGRNLSAGQRQLIALARAYLVDPDILLLDEATAALDLAAEAAVVRATERLTARRTTVLVAHRLTTAARADRIAVVDGGRIVETGGHEQLLAAGGTYAALWAAFTGEPALAG
jgi:ATP-binding cassette subfamily B protein